MEGTSHHVDGDTNRTVIAVNSANFPTAETRGRIAHGVPVAGSWPGAGLKLNHINLIKSTLAHAFAT